MAHHLLSGSKLAAKIYENIKKEISALSVKPLLVAVQVGDDPSSAVYVESQKKNAQEVGIEYKLVKLGSKASEDEIIAKIRELNNQSEVSAIILQLPLPEGINYQKVLCAISPQKDAEGIHPLNLGKIMLGNAELIPCTPQAVMELISATGVKLYGKEVVIVGHSEIVGKPLSMLLLNKFATTRVCHVATSEAGNLDKHVREAEILVVAVGKPNIIKGKWVKEGAIVIDVGINKVGEKIVGDVEFEEASKCASYITPVPGGVGPLTVAMLMKNVLTACKISNRMSEG